MVPVFVLNGDRGWDRQSLKQEYVHCLGNLSANTMTLRRVVERLLSIGVRRKELVDWAVAEGYKEKAIRKLLSSLCLAAGERLRRPGAGPKTPPQARMLRAIARNLFGEDGDKFINAASRDAKHEAAVKRAESRAADLSKCGIRVDGPEKEAESALLLLHHPGGIVE